MENNLETKPVGGEAISVEALAETPAETKKDEKIKIAISRKYLMAAVIIVIVAFVGALIYQYKSLVIAATVNGSPIYRLSVVSELEKTAGKKTLEALITKKLISDEARSKGIVIKDAEVAAELKTVEDQVKAQGGTLDQALAEQGITLAYFKEQIVIQKQLEGLLADKIQVSDADITKYIADNKITVPKGQEATYHDQIKNQLKQQKLSDAASTFIASLKTKSKINYFINY